MVETVTGAALLLVAAAVLVYIVATWRADNDGCDETQCGIQAEQGVIVVGVIQHDLLGGLEIMALGFALQDLVHDHHHFWAGGQRVDDEHLSVGA